MAEFQNRQEQIGRGKRWVEEICGRSHAITEVHWNEHEETAHLHYWPARSSRQQREPVHLSFTCQELADCATNLDVRVHLMHRIREILNAWVEPREAQDF